MNQRWQYGSEFHWPDCDAPPAAPLLPPDAVLYGSGRDALRALVRHGMRHRAWKRLWLPSYFCPQVTEAMRACGVRILYYEDMPTRRAPALSGSEFRPGDVLLLVNYFGLRGPETAESLRGAGIDLIEDHTHDPASAWARSSRADYAFVSLRKTLPLPDGGALWSPRGHALPAPVPLTRQRHSAALKKLAAMVLETLYLDGQPLRKATYRALQLAGESEMGCGEISGPSALTRGILSRLPWDAWRARRAANHQALASALADLPQIEVLRPAPHTGSCPFCVLLICRTPALREQLRTQLIARHVYPAVLWPIESHRQVALAGAEALSRRVLALACDFRYQTSDVLRVAGLLRRIVRAAKAKAA